MSLSTGNWVLIKSLSGQGEGPWPRLGFQKGLLSVSSAELLLGKGPEAPGALLTAAVWLSPLQRRCRSCRQRCVPSPEAAIGNQTLCRNFLLPRAVLTLGTALAWTEGPGHCRPGHMHASVSWGLRDSSGRLPAVHQTRRSCSGVRTGGEGTLLTAAL